MAATLLLDRTSWDLVVDANGNIAVATEPYSLAQDAASAILTWLGECYWDTTVGVPWLTQILSRTVPLSLIKQQLIEAALTVPDVASAQVFLNSIDSSRILTGQVQVVSASSGQVSVAPFTAINPQGA